MALPFGPIVSQYNPYAIPDNAFARESYAANRTGPLPSQVNPNNVSANRVGSAYYNASGANPYNNAYSMIGGAMSAGSTNFNNPYGSMQVGYTPAYNPVGPAGTVNGDPHSAWSNPAAVSSGVNTRMMSSGKMAAAGGASTNYTKGGGTGAPMTYAQQLAQTYEQAMAEAKTANESRYNEILGGNGGTNAANANLTPGQRGAMALSELRRNGQLPNQQYMPRGGGDVMPIGYKPKPVDPNARVINITSGMSDADFANQFSRELIPTNNGGGAANPTGPGFAINGVASGQGNVLNSGPSRLSANVSAAAPYQTPTSVASNPVTAASASGQPQSSGGYRGRETDALAAYEAANQTQGYNDRYARGMANLQGLGRQELIDANNFYDAEDSRLQSNLAARGLLNSTISPNVSRGVATDRQNAIGRINESIRQQRLETDAALSGDALNYASTYGTNRANFGAGLSGDTLQFMERRDDEYPDMNQYLQLMMQLGQSGQLGYGGGGDYMSYYNSIPQEVYMNTTQYANPGTPGGAFAPGLNNPGAWTVPVTPGGTTRPWG